MDKQLEITLKQYANRNPKKWWDLNGWIKRKVKPFSTLQALEVIYNAANGSVQTITDIIEHLTDKGKAYGRTQVYGDAIVNGMDIRKNENGELELFGYNPNKPLTLKGQHTQDRGRMVRQSDGQTSKTYQNTAEKLYDLGKVVRDVFPDADNSYITLAMQAIRNFAALHHLRAERVARLIKQKKYKLVEKPSGLGYQLEVVSATNESKNRKVIVITEAVAQQLEMTEYKFNNAIKKYLHDLLVDPVNAEVPDVLKMYGYRRGRLIGILKNNDLLRKSERIVDKDENGMDKTATMQVKYQVPKKNFDRKLRNLYIKLFERNVPERNIEDTVNEDGECGAMGATNASSSGQYSQPLFPMQRRQMPVDIEEDTTTSTVGNYQYDVPFVGDKETLSRKNGKGGSTSVQIAENDNVNEYLDNNMLNVRKNIKNAVDDYGYNWAEEPYDKKEIVKNEWMLHFSETKNASNIATNGFKKANDYTKSPEQVTYQKSKSENGFNYAYLATDVLQYWKDGGQSMGNQPFLDYLMNERRDNFVMFKGNGFRFYHDGDGEEQVVFNNIQPGTKVLVMYINDKYCVMNNANPELMHRKNPLQKSEGGLNSKQWSNPKNTMSNILYFSAEIEKVIEWVMTNYEQYKKSLEYNKIN